MLTNRQLFLQHLAQTSSTPLLLEIEKAEGVFMFDTKGNSIIDLISGIGVSNVGHRHPKVLEAIREQLDKYLHLMVYGEFIQAPQIKLAESLCSLLPPALNSVYFVNSGSEAVEGALKLAKRYTGRSKIISFVNSYHGSTHGSLSVNGNEAIKRAYRPLLPGIYNVPFNSDEVFKILDEQIAAVIIEPVQAEAGVIPAEKGFMSALEKKCKESGVLLIADEIQTGFGRTGTFWGFENYSITPDIVVCAKGMGGGMPLGAFISSGKIMEVLQKNPVLGHITTFGGHPVSCAASLATLKVILDENLLQSVVEKEKLFLERLKHPLVKRIRAKGLLMAVEFESYEILKKVIDLAILKGVLTDWFLFCDNSMRIAPPLVINKKEIEQACAILTDSMNEIYNA